MPTVRRASAGEIVLIVRATLATALSWQADRIPIVAGDAEVPHLLGDREVLIRVLGERPDRQAIDGAGRAVNRRERRIQVECRTRLFLDVSHEDRLRLTHASLGHLALEDTVCDALESLLPADDSQNVLVAGVVRCQDLSDPKADHEAREWVSSKWSVELPYDRDLDLTRL